MADNKYGGVVEKKREVEVASEHHLLTTAPCRPCLANHGARAGSPTYRRMIRRELRRDLEGEERSGWRWS